MLCRVARFADRPEVAQHMGTAFAQWLDVISRSGIPAADPAPITPVAPLHPQIVHGERGGSSGPHASSPPLTCRESCILISFVVALVPGPNLSLVIVVVLTVRFQLAFVIISPPAPVSRQKLLTVTLVGCRLPGFPTLEVPAIRRPVGPTRTFEAVTVSAAFSVTVNRCPFSNDLSQIIRQKPLLNRVATD
ncbi:Uncharacterised protein [Mycobacteroides abscessus subsp. abscessus]|nr:Uncharacterised protein [Mycobacteroides abscessus subsp. abscessus]SIH61219.1 Uncharacterised protein [Mycobacteroides abscessus subsp. abscessus]SII93062.1 Uncharacterised protein [Mycobacteroides abscessus subsp. abscessus]SIJ49210.1 Uncharacterised protein [Mycobacteroides abscessus subsp. abscessus]SIK03982.1 Uncharacterised protein [Mycobacteroides abscessus subsp. abscessus]